MAALFILGSTLIVLYVSNPGQRVLDDNTLIILTDTPSKEQVSTEHRTLVVGTNSYSLFWRQNGRFRRDLGYATWAGGRLSLTSLLTGSRIIFNCSTDKDGRLELHGRGESNIGLLETNRIRTDVANLQKARGKVELKYLSPDRLAGESPISVGSAAGDCVLLDGRPVIQKGTTLATLKRQFHDDLGMVPQRDKAIIHCTASLSGVSLLFVLYRRPEGYVVNSVHQVTK